MVQVGLGSLPDLVLLQLVKECPVLGLLCRRFHDIAEFSARHELIELLDISEADRLMSDVRSLLGMESWEIALFLAKFDFWFFDPDSIVNLQPGDLSIRHVTDKDDDSGEYVWQLVYGLPWGASLVASNVVYLRLRYATKLTPGIYRICVNLTVDTLFKLLPVRFSVLPAQGVRQIGSPFPKFGSISQTKNVELQLSALEISGGLREINFEIEDVGPFLHKGFMFNYMYFERVDHVPDTSIWHVLAPRFRPQFEWRQVFQRVHDRKKYRVYSGTVE